MGPLAQRLSLDVCHHHSFQGGGQLEDASAAQASTPLHRLGPEPFLVPIWKIPTLLPRGANEHPCSESPCRPGLPTSSSTSFTPPHSAPRVRGPRASLRKQTLCVLGGAGPGPPQRECAVRTRGLPSGEGVQLTVGTAGSQRHASRWAGSGHNAAIDRAACRAPDSGLSLGNGKDRRQIRAQHEPTFKTGAK